MRKIMQILVIIGILSASLTLMSCNKTEIDNGQDLNYAELQVSDIRDFDFQTDSCGWQLVAIGKYDNARWISSGKTGAPCVEISGADLNSDDVSPNAIMYNKFALKENDKYLVINANIIGDLQTLFRVKAIAIENGEETSGYLNLLNSDLKADNNGFYKLTGLDNTIFKFDISAYANKTVVFVIENESISPNGKEGLYINSIKLTDDINVVSSKSSWSVNDIASEWQLRGNVAVSGDNIVLVNNGQGALISNILHINNNHKYLRISFKANTMVQPRLKLLVDDNAVLNQNGTMYAMGSTSEYTDYIYDLSEYVDLVSTIKISNESKGEAAIKSISLDSAAPGKTNIQVWGPSEAFYDWSKNGTVELHKEGICLESVEEESWISNNITISESSAFLVISFRKFVRESVQDEDPQILVYVNDQLINAIGHNNYVTATSDDYAQYSYSLSQFTGQNISIKIVNQKGEHACFDSICVYQISI